MDFNQLMIFINDNIAYILIATLALLLLATLIFVSISIRLNKLLKRYNLLMRGMEEKNLEEIMLVNRQMIQKADEKIEIIDGQIKGIEQILIGCIRKVGIVRYNAFPDMGSDLSFAIALLDERGDGVVISGLTGRQDSRTYSKPILAGKSTYLLTEEEQQAIKKALSQ